MPLAWPPREAASLTGFPSQPLRDRTIYRVWRHRAPDGATRDDPWWFSSVPDDPDDGGRYDLPAPMGACYTATRPIGALLEALQAWLATLPAEELRLRLLATIETPSDAPPAAQLTARTAAGRFGMTAALWAGAERRRTQAWAAAFRRDGWWSLYGGIQHDPSGQLRGHALFDHEGAHPPTFATGWSVTSSSLHDEAAVLEDVERYGIDVREPGDLPFAEPPGAPTTS